MVRRHCIGVIFKTFIMSMQIDTSAREETESAEPHCPFLKLISPEIFNLHMHIYTMLHFLLIATQFAQEISLRIEQLQQN